MHRVKQIECPLYAPAPCPLPAAVKMDGDQRQHRKRLDRHRKRSDLHPIARPAQHRQSQQPPYRPMPGQFQPNDYGSACPGIIRPKALCCQKQCQNRHLAPDTGHFSRTVRAKYPSRSVTITLKPPRSTPPEKVKSKGISASAAPASSRRPYAFRSRVR